MVAIGEAASPAYEPFNYAPNIPISGLNGGAGWGGPWTGVGNLIVGPGLTYVGLAPIPAGNALGWTPGAASRRPLAAPVVGAPGITLVLRALIRSNVNGTPATQATLGNSSGGTFIIGDLPQPNPNAGKWGMQNSAGCFYSTHPVVANATTLLVAQIDFNVSGGINERMRLWVNPSPPDMFFINPPDIDVTNANVAQFSGVFWQTQQGQRLDEILINMTGSACVPPPNTTMVAWYPFDETAGATAANLATGNTGAHIGGPTPVPGMVAGALRFNGTTNYVESPSTIVTNFGPANTPNFCLSGSQGSYSTCLGDFSIDAWVCISPNAPQGVMTILDKRSAVPVLKGYAFFVYQGKLGLQLADGIGAPPARRPPAVTYRRPRSDDTRGSPRTPYEGRRCRWRTRWRDETPDRVRGTSAGHPPPPPSDRPDGEAGEARSAQFAWRPGGTPLSRWPFGHRRCPAGRSGGRPAEESPGGGVFVEGRARRSRSSA